MVEQFRADGAFIFDTIMVIISYQIMGSVSHRKQHIVNHILCGSLGEIYSDRSGKDDTTGN
jgi:hypothetical protein